MKRYFINIRAVDEAGNRSFYLKYTIVNHIFTGIKDRISLTPGLMVFPNPASELVNLKIVHLDYTGDYNIRIIGEAGSTVIEKEFSFRTNDHYSVDVAGLISGLYSIAIYKSTGKLFATAKFVKK